MKIELNVLKGDITTVGDGLILHQVNCFRMGSGVAKALYSIYPKVKQSHQIRCSSVIHPEELLGHLDITTTRGVTVVSMFSQLNYGYDGKQYTRYDALTECLRKVKEYNEDKHKSIFIPWGLGAGLGGGDWNEIVDIIVNTFIDSKYYDIFFVRLDESTDIKITSPKYTEVCRGSI